MPNYAWDIKIGAGTKEEEPLKKELELISGIITKIEIVFAPGCHRLVKTRLLRSTFQIWPRSGGEWYTGDGETIVLPEHYELVGKPLSLEFVGCSPLTAYSHTVTVRISIQSPEIASPLEIMRDFVSIVKKLMGLA